MRSVYVVYKRQYKPRGRIEECSDFADCESLTEDYIGKLQYDLAEVAVKESFCNNVEDVEILITFIQKLDDEEPNG